MLEPLKDNLRTWYSSGGILDGHKVNCYQVIQQKFYNTQQFAKNLYDGKSHEQTPGKENESLPPFVKSFFHYFDWMEERRKIRNPAAAARHENLMINRETIGQQGALNSTNQLEFNNTSANPGRERGSGEIAGQTNIRTSTSFIRNTNTVSDVNDSSSLSNNSIRLNRIRNAVSTRDPPARNMRSRRLNVHGGISPGAILPPSTRQDGFSNVTELFNQYSSFATSLDSLSREHRIKTILAHSRFRPTNVVDDEILKYEREKYELECQHKQHTTLYISIERKLKSLEKEKRGADSIDRLYLRIVDNENQMNNSNDNDQNDNENPNSIPDL